MQLVESIRVEGVKVNGCFWFSVYDMNGRLKEERVIPNTMTTTGLASVAALIVADKAYTAYDYIAIGTGTGASAAADVTLGTESVRFATTGTTVTTTGALDTAQFVGQTSFGSSLAITEVGVLNASSDGNLLCRQTFAAINVISGDSLNITYKVKCA